MVIKIEIKIGRGSILNAWKSIAKIASFIIVYLVAAWYSSSETVHGHSLTPWKFLISAHCTTIAGYDTIIESLAVLHTFPLHNGTLWDKVACKKSISFPKVKVAWCVIHWSNRLRVKLSTVIIKLLTKATLKLSSLHRIYN